MARKERERIEDLTGYAVVQSGDGQSKYIAFKKDDVFPVLRPRGEAKVARDLCAKHGCTRVVLVFGEGAPSERTRTGSKTKLSPMGRYLLEKAGALK